MKLAIVIGSIRENRMAPRLAGWVHNFAALSAPDHEWEVIDLKEFDLPMFAEPFPPMDGKRPELTEGTRRYLERMDQADGFIFVVSEYNHGMTSSLKNAIDLLDFQLQKKPVAIVSHGVVGGARANEQVRLVVNSTLGAVPISNSLTFFGKVRELISEDGELLDNKEVNERSLRGVVTNLVWYADALKEAREK